MQIFVPLLNFNKGLIQNDYFSLINIFYKKYKGINYFIQISYIHLFMCLSRIIGIVMDA